MPNLKASLSPRIQNSLCWENLIFGEPKLYAILRLTLRGPNRQKFQGRPNRHISLPHFRTRRTTFIKCPSCQGTKLDFSNGPEIVCEDCEYCWIPVRRNKRKKTDRDPKASSTILLLRPIAVSTPVISQPVKIPCPHCGYCVDASLTHYAICLHCGHFWVKKKTRQRRIIPLDLIQGTLELIQEKSLEMEPA